MTKETENNQENQLVDISEGNEGKEFIATLNKQGYMATTLNPYAQQFVDYATQHIPNPTLEIGSAYGVATLAALEKGISITANDIDKRHLEILVEKCNPDWQSRLSLAPGAFPDRLSLPENHYQAILISRVLHFFDGPTIQRALKKLHRWLKPGGKVFAITETPYMSIFEEIIPVYEQYKSQNKPWPSMATLQAHIDEKYRRDLPPVLHFLDPDTLSREFKQAGFTIEKCEYFPRPNFAKAYQRDGRESTGVIAVK